MSVVVRFDAGDASFPADLTLERLWVIQGDAAWQTSFAEVRPARDPEQYLEGVARNGPKWPTASFVDVVVEVSTSEGAQLMGVEDVEIQRTD